MNSNSTKPFCNICRHQVDVLREIPPEEAAKIWWNTGRTFYVECHTDQLIFELRAGEQLNGCYLFGPKGSYYSAVSGK